MMKEQHTKKQLKAVNPERKLWILGRWRLMVAAETERRRRKNINKKGNSIEEEEKGEINFWPFMCPSKWGKANEYHVLNESWHQPSTETCRVVVAPSPLTRNAVEDRKSGFTILSIYTEEWLFYLIVIYNQNRIKVKRVILTKGVIYSQTPFCKVSKRPKVFSHPKFSVISNFIYKVLNFQIFTCYPISIKIFY